MDNAQFSGLVFNTLAARNPNDILSQQVIKQVCSVKGQKEACGIVTLKRFLAEIATAWSVFTAKTYDYSTLGSATKNAARLFGNFKNFFNLP